MLFLEYAEAIFLVWESQLQVPNYHLILTFYIFSNSFRSWYFFNLYIYIYGYKKLEKYKKQYKKLKKKLEKTKVLPEVTGVIRVIIAKLEK